MDDPTACWHRYLVTISAPEPDEDEATKALLELVQWLRVGGRPPDGFTTSEIRALVAGIKTDTAPGWRCGRSSQPWGLPLSAGDDHVDVARAAGAADKAFAPIEHRGLGAVALGLLCGVGLYLMAQSLHQTMSRTWAAAALPASSAARYRASPLASLAGGGARRSKVQK